MVTNIKGTRGNLSTFLKTSRMAKDIVSRLMCLVIVDKVCALSHWDGLEGSGGQGVREKKNQTAG